MSKEIQAGQLTPGDIVALKHGAQAVSHIITYPPLTETQTWCMVDVFFVGQSYPLYYRDTTEVEVIRHLDLDAVRYAVEELAKPAVQP